MNQVLEFNRFKPQQADTIALDKFVSECIQINLEAVSDSMSVTKHIDPLYVIDTFSFRIVAALMVNKEKQEIVDEWIISGTIFLLRDRLVEGFKKTLCK
jgi:hypothetical protein